MLATKRFYAPAVLAGLLLVITTRSLAVTYLSNLADATWGGYGVNGNWGLGQPFRTGSTASGYALNSVTLSMVGWYPGVSGFNVSIYSSLNGKPASPLQVLGGNADPQAEGYYNYNASGLTLNPSTTYWIVARASGAVEQFSSYFWEITKEQTYVAASGWQIPFGDTFAVLNVAANQWAVYDADAYGAFKFSLAATAVPEPAAGLFIWLGLSLAMLKFRTRQ